MMWAQRDPYPCGWQDAEQSRAEAEMSKIGPASLRNAVRHGHVQPRLGGIIPGTMHDAKIA